MRHAIAGFTNSASGSWTYLDVEVGDFVSFLYGARAFNLYRVKTKAAYKNAAELPPWPHVTFRPSGRTYYFPFRLDLEPVRIFDEPLVRTEFAYVAENLLLRGGYRKTHFQADQTTLQAASEMGRVWSGSVDYLSLGGTETFEPMLARTKELVSPPEVFLFRELFLQAAVRKYLSSPERLAGVFDGGRSRRSQPRGHGSFGRESLP